LSQNLKLRIAVALVAGPAILVCIKLGGHFFLFATLVMALGSLYEFLQMLNAKQTYPVIGLVLSFSAAMLGCHHFKLIPITDIILFAVLLLTAIEIFRFQGSPTLNLGSTLLSLLYITLPFICLLDMRALDSGGYFIMMIFFCVWMADTFAYFGGRVFGGKFFSTKFSERYSPKKTWEGFFTGAIASVISAYFFSITLLMQFPQSHLLILGGLIGLLSPIGDLIESMFKRDSGVKDSGVLPGHGGFFDRFDSLCFIAPVVLLYAKYFAGQNL
jgi:phosphatidate cytidylyltransferase